MKNKILSLATFVAISMLSIQVRAQSRAQSSWIGVPEKLYTDPSSTYVGIGTSSPMDKLNVVGGHIRIGDAMATGFPIPNVKLKFGGGEYVQLGIWQADKMLSFKANKYNFINGNVGIDVINPQYKLDVNGKVFIRTHEWINACAYSYLHWQCHRLVMGVPVGEPAVTFLDLMSGGSNEYDSLYSQFCMYTAYGEGNQVAKIKLNTIEHSWINTPSNFGIGTTNPLYTRDVRGTSRADEILVNHVSGADFVFDKSYNLRPLSEVSEYVQQHQHLPEIPSATEMQENGVNMNELQMQLLQKVEELTLYIIQQDQRIKELEEQLKKK